MTVFSAIAVLIVVSLAMAAEAVADPYRTTNIIGGRKFVLHNFLKFPKWVRVLPQLDPKTVTVTPQLLPWTKWAESLRALPPLERLIAINVRVNKRVRYVTDERNWGQRDYWEIPAEVAARGTTDCEGYAIFKNYLALQAGLDPSQLFVLVGIITTTREPHAVLIADADGPAKPGGVFILDNRLPYVTDIETARDLRAIYSLDMLRVLIYVRMGGG